MGFIRRFLGLEQEPGNGKAEEPEEDSKVTKVGFGASAGVGLQVSAEIGIARDSKGDVSPYCTVGIGVGVGVATKVVGAASRDEGTVESLDDEISKKTTIMAGPGLEYDNEEREGEGVTGIGVGGGVTWSTTITKYSTTRRESITGINNLSQFGD